MKRYAEAVLNGHPDKFCDIIADRILLATAQIEAQSYGQIEAAVWSDQLFLTGALVTSKPLDLDIRSVITQAGTEIGYVPGNHIDVNKYVVHDHICRVHGKLESWNNWINDQSIVHAYAGYDAQTRFLPPEQFAVWYMREALIRSCTHGMLRNCGPDGKLLIVMQEYPDEWVLEKVLVTLQQPASMTFHRLVEQVAEALWEILDAMRGRDSRWIINPRQTQLIINPNGPLVNGGSDGDNGQTGRKLVMDYYGPRVPLGGGALYGKHPTHIDRLASFAARDVCLNLLKQAEGQEKTHEISLMLAYAPRISEPLDIRLSAPVRPEFDLKNHLTLASMRSSVDISGLDYGLEELGTFYGRRVPVESILQGAEIVNTSCNH